MKKRIGPALANVYERRSFEWLNKWIRNSQAVIAEGDEIGVSLWEEYGKTVMPAYPFSDQEIMELLTYIKSETEKGPAIETVSRNETDQDAANKVSSSYLYSIITILTIVLAIAFVALLAAIRMLAKYLKTVKNLSESEREIAAQRFDFIGIFKSNTVVGSIVFLLVMVVLKTLIDGAFTIGVQQGYQPTQPIAFSHKLHAGTYEIDCQYCHTGVLKSKSANIPSPNICMNCHTQVLPESEEIKKIFTAIDYDPTTKTYGTNTQPIEWVRVHNLPDLAYFNHSQHVKVGEIACQTCHGPIEEMDVVYQHANLTMGWCIDCHRETEINFDENEYYTQWVKQHTISNKNVLKVKDIGGLECSKCHY